MKDRRSFLYQSSLVSAGLSLLPNLGRAALPKDELDELVIVHTNDMHSHIEPFEAEHPKYPSTGGMAARAQAIDALRKEHGEILLLDSGDIFQGTPYFNYFGGELELRLMSLMGYDATTMGNHDFDAGLDGFMKVKPFANFPYICSNYDFSDTALHTSTIPHKVFIKKGIKVGVFGLGIELEGLVDAPNCKGVRYLDPIAVAKQKVDELRFGQKCDLIICLSHLGYAYSHAKVSDLVLAEEVKGIDVILGGHTHTFLDAPTEIRHASGFRTLVNQAGWAGVQLGVVKFSLLKDRSLILSRGTNESING